MSRRTLAYLVALLGLTLLIPGGRPGEWSGISTGIVADNPCWKVKRAERGFAKKMNAARANNGKGHLSLDPEASKAARKHTYEMTRKNLLHHTSNNMLARRVTRWVTLGENVGVGGTVDSLHKAFMNSPAHRSNIMYSSFRHVGVGTVKKGNRLWVTVIFESQQDPGTILSMPKC